MAVAQLYFHLAPKAEVGVIAKALVRLMRSHRSVVLLNVYFLACRLNYYMMVKRGRE